MDCGWISGMSKTTYLMETIQGMLVGTKGFEPLTKQTISGAYKPVGVTCGWSGKRKYLYQETSI